MSPTTGDSALLAAANLSAASVTGSSDWPRFIYPQAGDSSVDITQPVRWTAVNNARAYRLQIGTTLGGNDVFDSGLLTNTSVAMPVLPAGVVLYARVRAVLNGWGDDSPAGHWQRGSYTRFRTDDLTPASTFTNVGPRGMLAAGAPIEWNASPLAIGYRLIVTGAHFDRVGNYFNSGVDMGDSGVIHTTHIALNAAFNATVSATLETIYLNRTASVQLTFIAAGGRPSFAQKFDLAKKLTADVRSMADRDNQPYGLTALDDELAAVGASAANCVNFEATLEQLIREANAGLNVRVISVALQNNLYDGHTLAEVFDESSGRWATLDPTFGLVTLRPDGVPATSAEISAAARAQNWSALNFDFLTKQRAMFANDYYIDYPLLFMNIRAPDGVGFVQDSPASLTGYLDSLPLPVAGSLSAYLMQCAGGFAAASVATDFGPEDLDCSGVENFTHVFWASAISAPVGNNSVSAVWRLRRFIF